ncbi:MAG: hypothetical protein JW818_15895 [Pirellulales bacterium]|nr:hypothetical protein [Pirellulales bacterium]
MLIVLFLVLLGLRTASPHAVVFAKEIEKTGTSAGLWIGTSTVNITPQRPVALSGHHRTRIARKVASPCMATAVALESRQGDKSLEQAVMVSCDLISIRGGILKRLREKLARRLPDLDVQKVFLNGTHTHTGPVMTNGGRYAIPKDAVQPEAYVDFLVDRLGELVVDTWKARRPGGVSWGLGHAVVAQNRRMIYEDGTAKMYGPTHVDHFRRVEGREDHGVEVLFFWDENKKLLATAVNVACPAQEVESLQAVNADFWHETRLKLRETYGDGLCVLGWCGAAGDQSPHLQWRGKAEDRMRKQRGLSRLEEIARRLARAVDDAYEVARSDIHYRVPMVHVVKTIELPARMVTEEEVADAKTRYDALKKKKSPNPGDLYRLKLVLDRYQRQKTSPFYAMELHVLRLGDVAITTNPFELYTDYGIQMKARSKALQTFVIQLAGPGKYLPTAEAVKHGGYSTAVRSCAVGPKGGQVLVDRTVEEINRLWDAKQK